MWLSVVSMWCARCFILRAESRRVGWVVFRVDWLCCFWCMCAAFVCRWCLVGWFVLHVVLFGFVMFRLMMWFDVAWMCRGCDDALIDYGCCVVVCDAADLLLMMLCSVCMFSAVCAIWGFGLACRGVSVFRYAVDFVFDCGVPLRVVMCELCWAVCWVALWWFMRLSSC